MRQGAATGSAKHTPYFKSGYLHFPTEQKPWPPAVRLMIVLNMVFSRRNSHIKKNQHSGTGTSPGGGPILYHLFYAIFLCIEMFGVYEASHPCIEFVIFMLSQIVG